MACVRNRRHVRMRASRASVGAGGGARLPCALVHCTAWGWWPPETPGQEGTALVNAYAARLCVEPVWVVVMGGRFAPARAARVP